MSLSRELRALDTMKNLRLWMTCVILCHELRVLDFMISLGLSMILTTRGPGNSSL